jgi:hypothetical protein
MGDYPKSMTSARVIFRLIDFSQSKVITELSNYNFQKIKKSTMFVTVKEWTHPKVLFGLLKKESIG